MKRLFIFIFLFFTIIIASKSIAVEEKKSIAVFTLDVPVGSSSYSIYANSANMFSADLVNSLQNYKDVNVMDIATSENIIKATNTKNIYEKMIKEYKHNYTVDYDKAEKISSVLGVDYIVFVSGGFDTQRDFLKSNWKYRCQWIWANPVKPSALLNINIALIDVKNRHYSFEENIKKDISIDNFNEPSQNFAENFVPVAQIKKFTKPNAQKIAQKIHSVIYPDLHEKYSQKDAFIEKFSTNGTYDNYGTQNYNQNNPQENSVIDSRKENYKNWVQEKL